MTNIYQKIKGKHSWAIPAIFTFTVFILLLIWLKLDSQIPHWDMGRHLYNSVEYGQLWFDYFRGQVSFFELITKYFYYPPFLYQVALIFYLFANSVTSDVAVISNLFWIFILTFSVYNIGTKYWGRRGGLAALLFLFSMPMIIGQMREFQLDLPLTFWVALTHYLALRYKDKFNYKSALLLGAVIGLGMLLKWTYLAFAIISVGVVKIDLLISKHKEIKQISLHALIGGAVAVLIAMPWYWVNKAAIKADFIGNGIDAAVREGDPTGFTWTAITYYAKAIAVEYLLLIPLLIFIIGLYAIAKSKQNRSAILNLLVPAVLIYIIFSILDNKDFRYIMPIAIYLSLIGAASITLFEKRRYREILLIIFALIFVANNYFVSFYGSFSDLGAVKVGGKDSSINLIKNSGYTSGSPKESACNIKAAVSYIPTEVRARLAGNNTIGFNNWALAFYLEKSGRIWAGEGSDIENTDYWVVLLDGSDASSSFMLNHFTTAEVVKNLNCSDGTVVVVLRKKI